MKEKYSLEICTPGSRNNVWVSFVSDTPFQAISKGDIINPAHFPDATADTVLRVTGVEHIVWASENHQSKHRVCVYTENIRGDAKGRFGF